MHRSGDLLHQLADEHRDLAAASDHLRAAGHDLDPQVVRDAAVRIAEHELAHRLLVHPLLGREGWGHRIFTERREEQLLLAERLRRALVPTAPARRWGVASAAAEPDLGVLLDAELTEHTDREEILDFPHLRHVTSFGELSALGELRGRLRTVLRGRLEERPELIAEATWATASRRALPELLELPEDIVIDLPALEREAAATG
ncbi:MAG: hypothetical protein WEB09_02630 [Nitriliruptor sp.]